MGIILFSDFKIAFCSAAVFNDLLPILCSTYTHIKVPKFNKWF